MKKPKDVSPWASLCRAKIDLIQDLRGVIDNSGNSLLIQLARTKRVIGRDCAIAIDDHGHFGIRADLVFRRSVLAVVGDHDRDMLRLVLLAELLRRIFELVCLGRADRLTKADNFLSSCLGRVAFNSWIKLASLSSALRVKMETTGLLPSRQR